MTTTRVSVSRLPTRTVAVEDFSVKRPARAGIRAARREWLGEPQVALNTEAVQKAKRVATFFPAQSFHVTQTAESSHHYILLFRFLREGLHGCGNLG